MKIIVVGCGKVGHKIIEQLCLEDVQITLIDTRPQVVTEIVNEYDIMGVVGSGTDIDTLNEAGIEDADVLVAVAGSDELNLL